MSTERLPPPTFNPHKTQERGRLSCVFLVSSQIDSDQVANDEDVLTISKRLMAQNKEAYEVLAQ